MLYYLSLKKTNVICQIILNICKEQKRVEIVRPEETCPIGDGTFNF